MYIQSLVSKSEMLSRKKTKITMKYQKWRWTILVWPHGGNIYGFSCHRRRHQIHQLQSCGRRDTQVTEVYSCNKRFLSSVKMTYFFWGGPKWCMCCEYCIGLCRYKCVRMGVCKLYKDCVDIKMKGNWEPYKGGGGMGKSLCNIFVLFCLALFSPCFHLMMLKKTIILVWCFYKVIYLCILFL